MEPYIRYLVQLSASHPVVVSQDILDTQGNLLASRAAGFDAALYQRLAAAQLRGELADHLQLMPGFSSADLRHYFDGLIQSCSCFSALSERNYFDSILNAALRRVDRIPFLQQNLRVMAAVMPDHFERTLGVCLWVLLIGREMRLTSQDLDTIFLAALAQDVGMLHIDPAIIHKTDVLTVDEWVSLQSHVAISQQLLAQQPGISEAVIRAVGEHHERCDATGYPAGKVESELSLEGQVLALADALVGIYVNRCKPQGRQWREVLPVLQMNKAAYLYRSCELVSAILYRSELPLDSVVSGCVAAEFAGRLYQQNNALERWFIALREALIGVGYTHGDRRLHSLQNVVLHIATTFKGNMLFDETLRASLQSLSVGVKTTPAIDIDSISLQQQEMAYHLLRVSRMFQAYVSTGGCKDQRIQRRLTDGLVIIQEFIQPSLQAP